MEEREKIVFYTPEGALACHGSYRSEEHNV